LGKRKLKSNQSCKPVSPQDSTYNERANAPQQPTNIPITSAHIPPSQQNPSSTEQSRSKTGRPWWKTVRGWKTIGEGIAVLTAIGLLIVNVCQMRSTEKAANAAVSAANTAHEALITSERPWLTVAITLQEPPHAHSLGPGLIFNTDGSATLNAFVVVKNIGHSPATSIYIRPQMYPPPFEELFTGPSEKQKTWCDKVRVEKPVVPMLPSLMPGEEDAVNFSFQMNKRDVQTAMQSPAFSGMQAVIPVIYGCVNYTSSLFEGVRQAPFMYELAPVRTTPGAIPGSKLELIKLFRGKAPD
jgi:hypothetical protein